MDRPEPDQIRKAVGIYIDRAYGGEGIPPTVRRRLERLGSGSSLDRDSVFEHDPLRAPGRYALRLGNRFYPHMKLRIEPRPDGKGFFFQADTHDRHICPANDSGEYALFCELREQNAAIARSIEAAWEEAGIATFRSYLREDLARRAEGAAAVPEEERLQR